jgi:protein TonB
MANQVLIPESRPTTTIRPVRAPKLLVPQTEVSVWQSLRNNLRDVLFPEKLPPLKLTSHPVKVKSIWGTYNNKKTATTTSILVHGAMIAALIGISIWSGRQVTQKAPEDHVTLVAPDISDYVPITKPAPQAMGGGGGGGAHEKVVAPKGKLPKQDIQQITPPMVQVRNEAPKLPVEPSVVVPPTVKLPNSNMPNLGDPKSSVVAGPLSNGTGSGGGIGSGGGGGIGSGSGAGVGPGIGGGFGGGLYHVGGGVSAPQVIKKVDPEYSEEARKAKYQGTVILGLIVDAHGRPQQLRVQRGLGMGLDQKALEAVRQWVFEPAQKDGKPVAVMISVEVAFRLF